MSSKTDRNGNVFTYTYSALGQLTGVTSKNSAGTTLPENKSFTYTKTGAIRTEANENHTATYTYDSMGRLTKTVENVGTIEKTFGYDLANNRTSFVLKVNTSVKENLAYTYDSMNRLKTVAD